MRKISPTSSIFYSIFAVIIAILAACTPSEPVVEYPDVFMWMGSNHLLEDEPRMYDNLISFARRHDIIPYESGADDPESLRRFLERCKRGGIPKTWIEIGPGRERVPIREFVENPESRKETLDRFRKLAEIYKSYYPEFARITIFDEAPLGAFKNPGTGKQDSYTEKFEEFKRYAPEAFSYLYKAIKEVFKEADVGIFMHHPHNASPDMAGEYSYIEQFMAESDSIGTLPDFIYSDVYRGYFNRGYGVEATNRYITDVVDYTKTIALFYGVEAYQLGQVHTIKLGYTPSKRQIDTNVDAMLAGNPDGIGWYWPNYASTDFVRNDRQGIGIPAEVDVSFNPFIPNSWGRHGPAGSLYGTSRDRFAYSYLRVLEETGNLHVRDKFDLWLYGHDFDHVEHKLSLKAVNPDSGDKQGWQLIGHFNPQQDRDGYEPGAREKYLYSYNDRWHAVVFHGLSRSDYFQKDPETGEITIEFKIETGEESDGSKFSAMYVLPYHQTSHYATESEVTRLIENQPRWVSVNSLADHIRPVPFTLSPDTVITEVISYPGIPANEGLFKTRLQELYKESE